METFSCSTALRRRHGLIRNSFLRQLYSQGSKIGSRATVSKITPSGFSTTTLRWNSQRTWKWTVQEWKRFVATNWGSPQAMLRTPPTMARRIPRPWVTMLPLGPRTGDISTNKRTRIDSLSTETVTGLSARGWIIILKWIVVSWICNRWTKVVGIRILIIPHHVISYLIIKGREE